jgi:hypothetical protein
MHLLHLFAMEVDRITNIMLTLAAAACTSMFTLKPATTIPTTRHLLKQLTPVV